MDRTLPTPTMPIYPLHSDHALPRPMTLPTAHTVTTGTNDPINPTQRLDPRPLDRTENRTVGHIPITLAMTTEDNMP